MTHEDETEREANDVIDAVSDACVDWLRAWYGPEFGEAWNAFCATAGTTESPTPQNVVDVTRELASRITDWEAVLMTVGESRR